MNKAKLSSDKMRAEYRREDLGKGVRGKYVPRYAKASNIVVIDPALTKAFPNSEAVNNALRGLLGLAAAVTRSTRPPGSRPENALRGNHNVDDWRYESEPGTTSLADQPLPPSRPSPLQGEGENGALTREASCLPT
jgi:hypothetical protein